MTRWYSVKRPPVGPELSEFVWGIHAGHQVRVRVDVEFGEGDAWFDVVADAGSSTIVLSPIDPDAAPEMFCGRSAVLEVRRPCLDFDLGHVLALGSWLDMDPVARGALTRAACTIVERLGFQQAVWVMGPWVELALAPLEAGDEP